MRQVTLLQLKTRVRQRANMENSQFIGDPELTDYINESLAELHDLIISSENEEYIRKSATITTTSIKDTYGIADGFPIDFFRAISVDVSLGGGMVITARKYMEGERNIFRWSPGWTWNSTILYRILGSDQIRFIPSPPGNFSATINYIPCTPHLNDDTDVYDGVNGWEEYAVWDATIKCLGKEESDTSFAERGKANMLKRIEDMAGGRDLGYPERVHDVDAELDGFGYWWL